MKKKLKIDSLQINSFVTSLSDANQSRLIKGMGGISDQITATEIGNICHQVSVPCSVNGCTADPQYCNSGATEVPSSPCCDRTINSCSPQVCYNVTYACTQ